MEDSKSGEDDSEDWDSPLVFSKFPYNEWSENYHF